MIKILSLLTVLLSSACSSKPRHIILTPENSVTLRSAVDNKSIEYVINKIMKLDKSLPKDEPIYLVLDSPGGSVIAGMRLIDFKKGLKDREVKTISLFAASMAAQIVQSFDERLITNNGIIMFHPPSANCSGTLYQIRSCVEFINRLDDKLTIASASRLKMNLEKYREWVRDEQWLIGSDVIMFNAADKYASIECSQELIDEIITLEYETFLGVMKVEVSACPFINRKEPQRSK